MIIYLHLIDHLLSIALSFLPSDLALIFRSGLLLSPTFSHSSSETAGSFYKAMILFFKEEVGIRLSSMECYSRHIRYAFISKSISSFSFTIEHLFSSSASSSSSLEEFAAEKL